MPFQKYREAPVAPLSLVPTGYRRWRLWCLTTNDPAPTNYGCIAEINFRTVPGSDSLMDGVATSNVAFSGVYQAPKAFDGLDSTAWITPAQSGGIAGSWCEMNFAAPRDVNELRLQAFNTGAGAGQMISTFRIEYYDGAAWQTRYTQPTPQTWTASQTRVYTF